MSRAEVSVTGADTTSRALTRMASTVGARTSSTTRHHAMLLLYRIKANASGRPGPNIITGDYLASWQLSQARGAGGRFASGWVVSSDAPQAMRLEYGFVGPDSLGRVYNQAPLPHVRPALVGADEALAADLRDAVAS